MYRKFLSNCFDKCMHSVSLDSNLMSKAFSINRLANLVMGYESAALLQDKWPGLISQECLQFCSAENVNVKFIHCLFFFCLFSKTNPNLICSEELKGNIIKKPKTSLVVLLYLRSYLDVPHHNKSPLRVNRWDINPLGFFQHVSTLHYTVSTVLWESFCDY